MSNLTEIEAALEGLSTDDRRQLLHKVAASLGETIVELPPPRDFTLEQMQAWIAKDEEGMRRFNEGK